MHLEVVIKSMNFGNSLLRRLKVVQKLDLDELLKAELKFKKAATDWNEGVQVGRLRRLNGGDLTRGLRFSLWGYFL